MSLPPVQADTTSLNKRVRSGLVIDYCARIFASKPNEVVDQGDLLNSLEANIIVLLFEKAKTCKVSEVLFEEFLNIARFEAEPDLRNLEFYIDQSMLLPQIEWGLSYLGHHRGIDKTSIAPLDLYKIIAAHMVYSRAMLDHILGLIVPARLDGFDESGYLNQNTDILKAIAAGQFGSGREHFEFFGRDEERMMRIYPPAPSFDIADIRDQ